MAKLQLNLKEKYVGKIKVFWFNFTIDLAAVDYAEHIDEYHWFKIDLSTGEIHALGNQIIKNTLGTLKLYTGSGFWRVHGDWDDSSELYDFELGISLDSMEYVCTGIDEKEKDKLRLYLENNFYNICEDVLRLSSGGTDLSQYL